jgi:hypothetical protein
MVLLVISLSWTDMRLVAMALKHEISFLNVLWYSDCIHSVYTSRRKNLSYLKK